jgi:hypothetical protein
VTPAPHQSCVFSQQQLAAVAASISKLPRQSQAGPLTLDPPPVEGHQHGFDTAATQADQQRERPRARRASRRGSPAQEQGGGPLLPAGDPVGEGAQLSGFTVYTNSLQQEGGRQGRVDDGEVAQAPAQPRAAAPSPGRQLQSQGSGVAWRSISSAALSSRSAGSAGEEGAGPERQHHVQREKGRAGHHGLPQGAHGAHRAARHPPPQRGSLENDVPQPASPQDWQGLGSKLQQRGQQLPRLVLPGTDASQVGQASSPPPCIT